LARPSASRHPLADELALMPRLLFPGVALRLGLVRAGTIRLRGPATSTLAAVWGSVAGIAVAAAA
jgi:hypothetical protein